MHEIKSQHKRARKKRVGRGGKKGTYSGRGMKGQKSRAGNRPAPVVRELLKRYPKLKGYKGVRRKRKPQVVSLSALVRVFGKDEKDEIVSPTTLVKKGLVHKEKGKIKVKIIGAGELKEAFTFQDCMVSAGAKKAIEKSGGKIT